MKTCAILLLLFSLSLTLTQGRRVAIELEVFDTIEAIPLQESIQSPQQLGDIWSNCGTSADGGTINNVTISPNPPAKGQNLTVTASFTLKHQVTAGNVAIVIKYSFITVLNKNEPVCDLAKDAGHPCPIAASTITVTQSAEIPSAAPGGHYTGSIIATDQNGDRLFCIDLDFHL